MLEKRKQFMEFKKTFRHFYTTKREENLETDIELFLPLRCPILEGGVISRFSIVRFELRGIVRII